MNGDSNFDWMIGELVLWLIDFDFLDGLLFDLNEHELRRFKMKHITFIIRKIEAKFYNIHVNAYVLKFAADSATSCYAFSCRLN